MGRIAPELIERLSPDEVTTVRYNHEDCPAGTDTRRRLYITRKENGTIVGYCHNCGDSGVALRGSTTHRRKPSRTVVETQVEGELKMPPNLEFDPERWPNEALSWVTKAGLPLTTIREYALAWDLDARRVLIPKYDVDNELVMWQSRQVGLAYGPKYITERLSGKTIHSPMGERGETVILVEDMLSAIKIDGLVGYDVIPLFTSSVKLDVLLTHVEKYDTIVVWLDNDNTTVDRHRDNLARQLRSIGKRVEVVTHKSDPKHYSVREISEEIEDVLIKF